MHFFSVRRLLVTSWCARQRFIFPVRVWNKFTNPRDGRLDWPGNRNQGSGVACTRQPTPPTTALPCAHFVDRINNGNGLPQMCDYASSQRNETRFINRSRWELWYTLRVQVETISPSWKQNEFQEKKSFSGVRSRSWLIVCRNRFGASSEQSLHWSLVRTNTDGVWFASSNTEY